MFDIKDKNGNIIGKNDEELKEIMSKTCTTDGYGITLDLLKIKELLNVEIDDKKELFFRYPQDMLFTEENIFNRFKKGIWFLWGNRDVEQQILELKLNAINKRLDEYIEYLDKSQRNFKCKDEEDIRVKELWDIQGWIRDLLYD